MINPARNILAGGAPLLRSTHDRLRDDRRRMATRRAIILGHIYYRRLLEIEQGPRCDWCCIWNAVLELLFPATLSPVVCRKAVTNRVEIALAQVWEGDVAGAPVQIASGPCTRSTGALAPLTMNGTRLAQTSS